MTATAQLAENILLRKTVQRQQRQEAQSCNSASDLPTFYRGFDLATGRAELSHPGGEAIANGKIVTPAFLRVGEQVAAMDSDGDVRVDKFFEANLAPVIAEPPQYWLWVSGFLGHCDPASRKPLNLEDNANYERFKYGYRQGIRRQNQQVLDGSDFYLVETLNHLHLRVRVAHTNRNLPIYALSSGDPPDEFLTVLVNVQAWSNRAAKIPLTREASGGVIFAKADRSGIPIYDPQTKLYKHEFVVQIAQLTTGSVHSCGTFTNSYTVDIKVEHI